MSNDTLFFVSLTLLAACGPQFEPADPSLCDGPPPTRTCGPGCRLVQTEPTRPGRALNTTPLDTTRAVSPAG